jgi:hypothetical protein
MPSVYSPTEWPGILRCVESTAGGRCEIQSELIPHNPIARLNCSQYSGGHVDQTVAVGTEGCIVYCTSVAEPHVVFAWSTFGIDNPVNFGQDDLRIRVR